jgi:hypothetical protein
METENEKMDVVMSDWNSKESTILRNAFDIDRNSLLEHIDTLKYHILHQKVEDEGTLTQCELHTLTSAQKLNTRCPLDRWVTIMKCS